MIQFLNSFIYRLTELLVQLRIQDSDVIVVNERSRPPRPATRIWFNEIIRNFAREEDDPSGWPLHYSLIRI